MQAHQRYPIFPGEVTRLMDTAAHLANLLLRHHPYCRPSREPLDLNGSFSGLYEELHARALRALRIDIPEALENGDFETPRRLLERSRLITHVATQVPWRDLFLDAARSAPDTARAT